MNETLYVLIEKKQTQIKFRNQTNVFTLNEYILSNKEKININHLYPDAEKTSLESENHILKSEKLKLAIYKKLIKI